MQVARLLCPLATWFPIASASATTLQLCPLLMWDVLHQRNCTVELLSRIPPLSYALLQYCYCQKQPCAVVSLANTTLTWLDQTAPRLRLLQLLLPNCIRFSCCSPIASSSAAALRVRLIVITYTQYKV